MDFNKITIVRTLLIASEYINVNAIKDKLIQEAKNIMPDRKLKFGYQKATKKNESDQVFVYYEN